MEQKCGLSKNFSHGRASCPSRDFAPQAQGRNYKRVLSFFPFPFAASAAKHAARAATSKYAANDNRAAAGVNFVAGRAKAA